MIWNAVLTTSIQINRAYRYNEGFIDASLLANGWLSDGALLVLEEAKDSFPEHLPLFEKLDERRLGETTIGFYAIVTADE